MSSDQSVTYVPGWRELELQQWLGELGVCVSIICITASDAPALCKEAEQAG